MSVIIRMASSTPDPWAEVSAGAPRHILDVVDATVSLHRALDDEPLTTRSSMDVSSEMDGTGGPRRRSFGEWIARKLAGDEPPPSGPVREISDDRLELTAPHTVLTFSASWCGPCRMLRPIIDELAVEHDEHEDLDFVRLDVDANPGVAAQYRVMSVPTVVVVDAAGAEDGRLRGLVPKRDLDAFITQFC